MGGAQPQCSTLRLRLASDHRRQRRSPQPGAMAFYVVPEASLPRQQSVALAAIARPAAQMPSTKLAATVTDISEQRTYASKS